MRRAVEHVDETYTKPGVDHVGHSFERRPVFTTFVLIFSLLSLIPVLSFAAFTVFVFGLFLSLAIGTALAAAILVTLLAGGALACTLLCLLFVASFLTCSVLGTLVAGRLVFYMRAHGLRGGLSAWMEEMRERLVASAPEGPAEEPEDIVVKTEPVESRKEGDQLSDSSSTVAVERFSDGDKPDALQAE